jgi:hypothetical protein
VAVTPPQFGPSYEDHNPRVPRHLWQMGRMGEQWFADHYRAHGFEVEGFDVDDGSVPDGTISGAPVEVKTISGRRSWDRVHVADHLIAHLDAVPGLLIGVVHVKPVVDPITQNVSVHGPWGARWDEIRPHLSGVEAPAYEGGTPYRHFPRWTLKPCAVCRMG